AWFFDEAAHAGAEHLDPEYVRGYDRKASTSFDEDVDSLVSLGLDARSTIVDLGCGTAEFAAVAASRCRRVVCVDVSAEILDAARARGLPENVELVQAGFLDYEHEGEPPDFVYSRHALHHLPDFWKAVALSRIHALLAVGGYALLRDLVFSFDPADADDLLEQWL